MSIETTHTVNQMETPHSSVGVFELPCGYLDENGELHRDVKVREISGHEEDMLASKKTANNKKLNTLLAACVERVGSVDSRGKLAKVIKDLTMGDRVFLLFAIRRVTLGDELPVREVCPACKTKSLFMVDLGEELEIKVMPAPMKRIYDVTTPSGKEVRFRVSTGHDEERVAKIQGGKSKDSASQSLLMRLELLDGEPPDLKSVKGLSMRDRHFLRAEFEKVEGGVDTSIEFTCTDCGHEWEKDLNIGARDFFFPSET
jgi:hypothetical protein